MTSAHERLHMEAIRSWLAEQGWEPRPVSLYDDEGVEGWTWENAHSSLEFTTTGDWNDVPEIPDDLLLMATQALA